MSRRRDIDCDAEAPTAPSHRTGPRPRGRFEAGQSPHSLREIPLLGGLRLLGGGRLRVGGALLADAEQHLVHVEHAVLHGQFPRAAAVTRKKRHDALLSVPGGLGDKQRAAVLLQQVVIQHLQLALALRLGLAALGTAAAAGHLLVDARHHAREHASGGMAVHVTVRVSLKAGAQWSLLNDTCHLKHVFRRTFNRFHG
jgi:hypothetical protein